MPLVFYPYEDDLEASTMEEKIDLMMEAAERYKAVITEAIDKTMLTEESTRKRLSPRDITVAFNWEELAKLLRQIRELPETSQASKISKADFLTKLSEIYEVLRSAKMPKLEAVRIALKNEASQLRSSASQVA